MSAESEQGEKHAGGRPSKIHDVVTVDPERGEEQITKAILRYVEMGVWPGNAAAACGIDRTTLWRWIARADEFDGDGDVPESELPFVEFRNALTRAEAKGLIWHELNIRRAAAEGHEHGGRLSLEFLSRRQREQYGREVKLEHSGKVKHQIEQELDAEIEQLMENLASRGEG